MIRLNLQALIDEEFPEVSQPVVDESSSEEEYYFTAASCCVLDNDMLLTDKVDLGDYRIKEDQPQQSQLSQDILDVFGVPEIIRTTRECDVVRKALESQTAERAPEMLKQVVPCHEHDKVFNCDEHAKWPAAASYFMKAGFMVPGMDFEIVDDDFDGRLDFLLDNVKRLSYRGEAVQELQVPSMCYATCPPIVSNYAAVYHGRYVNLASNGAHIVYGGRSLVGVEVVPVIRFQVRGVWISLMLFARDVLEVAADKPFVLEISHGELFNASFYDVKTPLKLKPAVFKETPFLGGDALYIVDMVQYKVAASRILNLLYDGKSMVSVEGREVLTGVFNCEAGKVYECIDGVPKRRVDKSPMRFNEIRIILNSPVVGQMPHKLYGREFTDLRCIKPEKSKQYGLSVVTVDTPLSPYLLDDHTQGYVPGFISMNAARVSEGQDVRMSNIYDLALKRKLAFNGLMVRVVDQVPPVKGSRAMNVDGQSMDVYPHYTAVKAVFVTTTNLEYLKHVSRQFASVRVFKYRTGFIIRYKAHDNWSDYVLWWSKKNKLLTHVMVVLLEQENDDDSDSDAYDFHR